MSTLVVYVGSICEQLYRLVRVLCETGGSLSSCCQFIIDEREKYLTIQYLKYLNQQSAFNHDPNINNIENNFIIEKIAWLSKQNSSSKFFFDLEEILQREPMEDEIYEFIGYEEIASTYDWQSPEMVVGTQLIQEAGLKFSCSNLEDITPGTSFYITGTILHNCERFSINLTLGPHTKDIALHINPRLPQNYIVRNCKINGRWGLEEVTSPLPFRLKRGNRFSMQVLVTSNEYYISIDGKHFASFQHRLPYQRVTCLQVSGDVMDVQVEQLAVMSYPDKMAGARGDDPQNNLQQQQQQQYQTEDLNGFVNGSITNDETIEIMDVVSVDHFDIMVDDLELPYYGKLLSQFKSGRRLHFYGRVKMLPHSFYINLQKGELIWPHPTIAFHFNPRFANVGGKHVICRNSWYDGKWDREERDEVHTNFMPGQKFHLTIDCTDDSYHVSVNGKFISEYRFRCDPLLVDTVYLQGDIKLYRIILETSPQSLISYTEY